MNNRPESLTSSVSALCVAEVVRVVAHSEPVGARVVEEEDPNKASPAVVVADVADIELIVMHRNGLDIDRLSTEVEAALNLAVEPNPVRHTSIT
jgi:hypothetical protein